MPARRLATGARAWKPELSEDEERGRGLVLISALMDAVEITSGNRGTTVRLVRRVTGDE